MPEKDKNGPHPGWIVLAIFMVLADLALLLRRLLHGRNVALFNAQGLIAKQQHELMLYTVGVLLTIAIPTVFLLYFTAWKYRESNTKASYDPSMHHGKWFAVGVWVIPVTFMLMIASVMWPSTHELAPQKSIAADVKPLTIQVISMRWKWLFIYPEQGIASVNFVQFPLHTPVQFELTADEAPMSSFWIPNLGGQLYTMTGHVNRLNLMADTPGDYPGRSAEINGAGFSGMQLMARASSVEDFNGWVQAVKQSPDVLDTATYNNLLKPSEDNQTTFYSSYANNLYAQVLSKYTGLYGSHIHQP